jgi:predicted nucleic acid-binding protein
MLDLKEVNVQHQLDAPFLLSKTAGEVARQLNQIANLEVIDIATTNIARTIRQYSSEEGIQETELARIVNELRQYNGVPEQEKLIAELESLDNRETSKISDRDLVQLALDSIQDHQESLQKLGDVEGMTKLYDECECLDDALQKKWTSLKQVNEFVGDIEVSTHELEDLNSRLEAEQPYQEMVKMIEQAENLKTTEKRCGDLTMSLLKSQRLLKEQEQEYEKLNTEWKQIFPDECPLCGQKVIR